MAQQQAEFAEYDRLTAQTLEQGVLGFLQGSGLQVSEKLLSESAKAWLKNACHMSQRPAMPAGLLSGTALEPGRPVFVYTPKGIKKSRLDGMGPQSCLFEGTDTMSLRPKVRDPGVVTTQSDGKVLGAAYHAREGAALAGWPLPLAAFVRRMRNAIASEDIVFSQADAARLDPHGTLLVSFAWRPGGSGVLRSQWAILPARKAEVKAIDEPCLRGQLVCIYDLDRDGHPEVHVERSYHEGPAWSTLCEWDGEHFGAFVRDHISAR